MTDFEIGIKNLKACQCLADIAGPEHLARNRDNDLFRVDALGDVLQIDLLEVKDNVGHILLYTGYCVKLMLDTVDLDRSNGISLQSREKNTTKRVAHSDAIARLQRLEFKFAEEVIGLKHENLVGFLEC
jgi:hypothetical protein